MIGIRRYGRALRLAIVLAMIFATLAVLIAASAPTGIPQAWAKEAPASTKVTAGSTASDSSSASPKPLDPVVSDGLYNIASTSNKRHSVSIANETIKTGAKAALAETDTTNWPQKWIVVRNAQTGYYTIRNLRSCKVLGIAGTAKSGVSVKQFKEARTPSNKQLWILLKTKSAITFRSAADPSLAITVSGKASGSPALKLKPLAGAKTTPAPRKTQKFKLKTVEAIDDSRSFYIRSSKAGQSVSVLKDSRKDKAKLGLEKKSTARNQKFRFFSLGKSTYRVQCVSSCAFVGAKTKDVRQYAAKLGKYKRWVVSLDLQTGTFTFESAKSRGKLLDSTSGKLSLQPKSTSKGQRFTLVPTQGFKVYLDPGHGRSGGIYDPGAEGNGREEATLTKDLVERIAEHLKGTDVTVVNGGDYGMAYWKRNAKAASLGCDVVLSVHFDSDGGGSSSTMIGTSGPLSRSRAFNKIIHKSLISSIGLRDGGTMHRSDITVVNGRVPAVLMEVCFIDDYGSLMKYLSRRDSVAQSLAEGIVQASQDPDVQR